MNNRYNDSDTSGEDDDGDKHEMTSNRESSDSVGFSFKAEDLDLHEEVDFENLDDDILRFQQDPLVHEALHKAVDLKEYSAKIESDLRGIEIESIDDYLKESERLAQLHSQIKDCDEILEVMENMLGGFQKDLGGISEEIRSLQDNSGALNVKLKNRVNAYSSIDDYVTSLYVPEEVTRRIADGQVDEHFMVAVQVLDRHFDFLEEQRRRGVEAKSLDDVEPHIKKFCAKAVHKLREFLLKQFQTLRKPRTNIQIVQANVLIEYSTAYSFLAKHNSDAAQDVRNFYIDTMSKVYHNHLKNYVNSLLKLESRHPVKGDFVVENTSFRNFFSSKKALKSKSATFELGDREKILEMDETARIVPHISQKEQQRFPFEQLFRSMLIMLIDIASQEYLFCGRFFGAASSAALFEGSKSSHHGHGGVGMDGGVDPDIFSRIFEKSLDLIRTTTSNYLHNSYDPIAVLLMIRVCQNCLLVMSQRRVPCLDGFLDELNMTLWPRFKHIIECNVQSIRNASAQQLFDGNINGHVVALRYAELVGSIQRINPFHTDIFSSSTAEANYGASSPSSLEANDRGHRNGKENGHVSPSSPSLNEKKSPSSSSAETGQKYNNNNNTNHHHHNNNNTHHQNFDTVDRSISVLRGELETLLMEISRLFSSKKERLVFIINSTDKIVMHLQEAGLSSSECDELSSAISLRDAHIDAFVEEELNTYFGDMIKFVVNIEKRLNENMSPLQCRQEYLETMEHLAREFAQNWKDVLRQLYEDVLKYFANFKTGIDICKKMFVQLVFYYRRFTANIVEKCCGKSFRGPIVKVNDMLYKIRNHYTMEL